MLKLLIYLSAVFLIATVLGFPTSEDENGGKSGYCRYNGLDIKEGETVPAPVGSCEKITCTNAADNAIISLTCALFQLRPGSKCHKSEKDLTKPYPHCCPKAICDEDQ